MAQLIYTQPATPFSKPVSDQLISFLQANLPDDFMILPQLTLEMNGQSQEVELLLLAPQAVMVAGVSKWHGRITSHPNGQMWRVGQIKKPQPNPLPSLCDQAQWVQQYLTRPEMWHKTGLDSRLAHLWHTTPALFFVHPQAQVDIPNPDSALLLGLNEAGLAQLTVCQFKTGAFHFTPAELQQLVHCLVGEQPAQPEVEIEVETEVETEQLEAVLDNLAEIAQENLGTNQPGWESATAEGWPTPEVHNFVHLPGQPDKRSKRKAPHPSLFQQFTGYIKWLFDGVEKGIQTAEEKVQPKIARLLNPDQLGQALEYEMEKTRCLLLEEIIANNHYLVHLASADYQRYRPVHKRWKNQVVNYLQRIIQSRGYGLIGPLHLEIVEDLELSEGCYTIQSSMEEGEAPPEASLVLEEAGQIFTLKPEAVTKIGRSEQADICVSAWDPKSIVSRLHARIQQEGGIYRLYDGDTGKASKFGTFVNGEPVKKGEGVALRPGDKIQLGKPNPGRGSQLVLTFQV